MICNSLCIRADDRQTKAIDIALSFVRASVQGNNSCWCQYSVNYPSRLLEHQFGYEVVYHP